MLVFCAHPHQAVEPQWVAPLASELRGVKRVNLYRPWLPLREQLQNPDVRDALSRKPRHQFAKNQNALRLPDWMFAPLPEAMPILDEIESSDHLIRSADRHLFCLMRSDLMLVDLSTPGYGDQGIDTLFGHLGGMSMIGLTDRFQNAPSLVSRLVCLIAPTSVEQIAHAIWVFGGRDEQQEPSEPAVSVPDANVKGPEVS